MSVSTPPPPPTADEPNVLIGLSGGGDSLALTHAAGAHAAALVVDHALSAGSAGRAAQALALGRSLCRRVEAVRLDWPEGRAPDAQARLRRARLAALARHARATGATHVALAHTQDDQAETVALRLMAGSGWAGLAGMAEASPFPLWPEGRGLTLLRPLLEAGRRGLRDRLRAAGLAWIEDPANEEARYARVRMRALRSAHPALDVPLLGIAAEAAAARAALDALVMQALPAAVRFEGPWIALDLAAYQPLPEGARLRLLAALLTAAGGGRPAAPEAAALAARAIVEGAAGLTVAGAWLRRRRGEVRIGRDPGALFGRAQVNSPAPLALAVGREAVFDGRLALTAWEDGWRAEPAASIGVGLTSGKHRTSLENAERMGLVEARWLLAERVAREFWRGGAAPASALRQAPGLFIKAVRSYVGLAAPGEGRPMKG